MVRFKHHFTRNRHREYLFSIQVPQGKPPSNLQRWRVKKNQIFTAELMLAWLSLSIDIEVV
jgi:hypothetical protein